MTPRAHFWDIPAAKPKLTNSAPPGSLQTPPLSPHCANYNNFNHSKGRKYGNRQNLDRHKPEIADILQIAPTALTANEASYLIDFRSADGIRNRLAKAKKITDLRLRSKELKRKI